MGLNSNINNDPDALELREKLMDAVGGSNCTDNQVLHELTAALACSAVFSGVWTKEEVLEAVSTLFDVSEEVQTLKLMNPFVGDTLASPPEA